MATKENMTFQRGMLKSIQTRVTTLASILFFCFYFAPYPWDDEFCRLPVRTWARREPSHTASLPLRSRPLHHYHPFVLFSLLMHFPCCCVSYSLRGKETPFLIIFLHHISPPLQIASPPSTTSSRKSICARGGTLSFWVGWLASASSSCCSTLCTDVLLSLIVYFKNKIKHSRYTGVSKIYAFILLLFGSKIVIYAMKTHYILKFVHLLFS